MKTFPIAILCLAASSHADPLSLRESLQEAYVRRAAYMSAKLNVESAERSARATGAFPSTTVGVGRSSQADLGATDMDLFVSQPLDVFGRSNALRKIGEAEVSIAQADLKEVQLTIQTEVATRFFEAVAASKFKASANNLLTISESLLSATKRRFEEGKIPEVQVTRSELERNRAAQTSSLRSLQYDAAVRRLMGVIGRESEITAEIDEEGLTVLPGAGLEGRPDLLRLAARLKVVKAEEVFARRSTLPELELIGLRSPWSDDPASFGARLQLTWAFNDFGRSRLEIAAAQKHAEAIRLQIEDVRGLAQAEVEAVLLELQASQQQVNAYRGLIDSNRELVRKIQLGFDQGVGTLIDVLEASRSLREVEQELAEAELSSQLSVIKLYEATGTLMEVNL